jgi:hypothetical protein
MRAEFLARGYTECSIPSCTRLVSPAFIRQIEGIGAVALCPDRQGRHAGRLGPTRIQALMRAYATAKPVNQPDPEPTDSGDSQVVVDLEAKRNGRKVH